MSDNYKPGTVAVATVLGVPNVRVMGRDTQLGCWISAHAVRGIWTHDATDVTDIRPLIVLDPKRHEFDPSFLARTLREKTAYITLPDAIEQQTQPPKPPEPTGLGAVVEDARGQRWIRADESHPQTWVQANAVRAGYHSWSTWESVNAVRVLSEGVTDE